MGKQTFTAGQVLTAAEMNSLQENDYNWTVTTKTASYTLAAGDEGTRIVMDNAGATAITVDDAVFAAGDSVWLHNIGAGTCTVTAGTATVNTAASLDLAQWEGGSLYFTSASSAIFFRGPAAGVATLEASGGTEVTSGGYKYHTFTSSGTLTVSTAGVCEVLVVGGGGGGHQNDLYNAGGGGAGGLVNFTNLYLTATSHTITIGAGGTGAPNAAVISPSGSESLIGSIVTAVGGGGGGANANADEFGGKGGSGGGSSAARAGAPGVSGQGNDGGGGSGGGGGGGAGAAGVGTSSGGHGGVGLDFSTWATATSTGDSGYYAGGGGGGDTAVPTLGNGGTGGGGNAASGSAGGAGSANTGGGGGAGVDTGSSGGNGGSGIVIVRYAV